MKISFKTINTTLLPSENLAKNGAPNSAQYVSPSQTRQKLLQGSKTPLSLQKSVSVTKHVNKELQNPSYLSKIFDFPRKLYQLLPGVSLLEDSIFEKPLKPITIPVKNLSISALSAEGNENKKDQNQIFYLVPPLRPESINELKAKILKTLSEKFDNNADRSFFVLTSHQSTGYPDLKTALFLSYSILSKQLEPHIEKLKTSYSQPHVFQKLYDSFISKIVKSDNTEKNISQFFDDLRNQMINDFGAPEEIVKVSVESFRTEVFAALDENLRKFVILAKRMNEKQTYIILVHTIPEEARNFYESRINNLLAAENMKPLGENPRIILVDQPELGKELSENYVDSPSLESSSSTMENCKIETISEDNIQNRPLNKTNQLLDCSISTRESDVKLEDLPPTNAERSSQLINTNNIIKLSSTMQRTKASQAGVSC